MIRRSWMVGLLAALVCTGSVRSAERRGEAGIYDPARDPARDLTVAIADARRDGKRILLEIGGNWCGWCREFERFLRTDATLTQELHCAFVVVRVNVSPENSNARFLSAYPKVPGYPYLFVLDGAGTLLKAVDTDDFLRGESYDRARLLAFVRKWSPPDPTAAGG